MANNSIFLTAPIPGQSLTVEPGSVPWEKPPQYVTLDEVASFYSEKLDNPEAIFEMLNLLDKKIPILTIVNTMIKASIMQGYHTVDTGFLVTPILVEIIKTLAELNDVSYRVSAEDAAKERTVSPAIIKQLIDEAKKKVEKSPEAVVERKGLMAKGVA
jgi:hypothetical protein